MRLPLFHISSKETPLLPMRVLFFFNTANIQNYRGDPDGFLCWCLCSMNFFFSWLGVVLLALFAVDLCSTQNPSGYDDVLLGDTQHRLFSTMSTLAFFQILYYRPLYTRVSNRPYATHMSLFFCPNSSHLKCLFSCSKSYFSKTLVFGSGHNQCANH